MLVLYRKMSVPQEVVHEFTFQDDGLEVTADSAPILAYPGLAELAGDAAFFAELNRVLSNLHTIKNVYPGIGALVSYATDAASNTFKICLG